MRNPLLNDDSIDDDQQLSQVNSFLLSLSDNDDGESQRVWIWTTRIDKFLLSNKRDQECYDRIRCHANNMWHFGRGMRFATVPSYDTWGREGLDGMWWDRIEGAYTGICLVGDYFFCPGGRGNPQDFQRLTSDNLLLTEYYKFCHVLEC